MATLHGLVVKTKGDAVIFFDGREEKRLTYERLHEIADAISSILNRNCEKGATIGIYMEMDVLVPAAILGILKASCCFVYLSPTESIGYLGRIIDRADVNYLITERNSMAPTSRFSIVEKIEIPIGESVEILRLAKRESAGSKNENNSDNSNSESASAAYVVFTSGTTGESKMVRVPHSCIVPNLIDLWNEYKISQSDVIFLSSPLTFDPSIVDIFLALMTGATLVVAADSLKIQPTKLAEAIFDRYGVTVLQTTPTLLLRFPTAVLKRILSPSINDPSRPLRILALGGEAFPCSALAPYLCRVDEFSTNHRLRIYNLYGPTEVSCWSTCHRVTENDIRKGVVPIGRPMLGTEIRLADENGRVVKKNDVQGELYVGGFSRRCFLDDELFEGRRRSPRLRSTGDLATRIEIGDGVGQYFLIGRADEQTKRMGKRLNLSQISQIMEENVNVKRCVVLMERSNLLRAFVQLHSNSFSDAAASPNFEKSVIEELRMSLRNLLPRHCQPDFFHLVDSVPTTKHGKVDKRALIERLDLVADDRALPPFCFESVADGVRTMLKRFVSKEGIKIDFDLTIRQLGIESLNASAFLSTLERWADRRLPKALEIMLTGTVSNLVQYLIVVAKSPKRKIDSSNVRKSIPNSDHFSPSAKRSKSDRGDIGLRIVEKCGRVRWIGNTNGFRLDGRFSNNQLGGGLKIKWEWNSGKCIDASPVVVDNLTSGESSVYIGSHSGKLACLDFRTGAIVWVQTLPDRVEASATITGCGEYVVVGCYDGGVYFFDRRSGVEWWTFKTGDAVKCTACADELSIVYVGSHDHRFYKLNYETKQCIWSLDLGSAVFSSPALFDAARSRICVATLSGIVYCLTSSDGEEIWHRRLAKPIFSSLVIVNENALVACVDGTLNWISIFDGSLTRRFRASGQIFATPTYHDFRNAVGENISDGRIFLSCENRIYCIDEKRAAVVWTRNFDDAILSSAFVFEIDSEDFTKKVCCCVVAKSGRVHLLDSRQGEIIDRYDLGGEIFSSPIIANNRILVGCRDDVLYCLDIDG